MHLVLHSLYWEHTGYPCQILTKNLTTVPIYGLNVVATIANVNWHDQFAQQTSDQVSNDAIFQVKIVMLQTPAL